MKYGSICSGIEAASVAWQPLGWEPAWFAEIDPFCCELLKQKHPGVVNYGDITKQKIDKPCDLIVGGTPCQSFSVQGRRNGVEDPRGQLAYQFVKIVSRIRPRWVVWENVPGVLSSNGGRDFWQFVYALAQCGYMGAHRVFDLRYFRTPQRRRRVILVAHLRDWRPAAGVLFEHGTNHPDEQPVEKIREDTSIYGWTGDETPKYGLECVPTLRASQGGEGAGVRYPDGRRSRLTLIEWERLQGFPDNYTLIECNGGLAADSVRRKALGNSFPVPIFEWLGRRIQEWETSNVS